MSDQAFGSVKNPARSDYPFVRIVEVGWGGPIGILSIDYPEGISFNFSPDMPAAIGPYAPNAVIPRADYNGSPPDPTFKVFAIGTTVPGAPLATLYDLISTVYLYFAPGGASCCGSPGESCDLFGPPEDLNPALSAFLTRLHAAGYTELSSGINLVMGSGPSNLNAPIIDSFGFPVLRPPDVHPGGSLPGFADFAVASSQTLYSMSTTVPVPFEACNVDDPANYLETAWAVVQHDEETKRDAIRTFWLINFKNEKSTLEISNALPATDPNLPGGYNMTAKLDIYPAGAQLSIASDVRSILSDAPAIVSQSRTAPYDAAGTLWSIKQTGFA